ncbi:MAG: Gfo/Idh/MocA family oxidoreductase [Phycisphaerales bacterium]|nr:MAG: Gfo/Idh/MocA family oxidoreductase [Phycisphaerales bacterium]
MKRTTRRDFIKASTAAALAAAVPFSRARGANNDIRAAVVGIRSQGANHINWFRNIPGVRVVAISDADSSFLDRERNKFGDRNEKVDAYVDFRKLLEDKSIDAIITATPNHWHALVTIWACQAGKDVYVEKPVSHNICEGRTMVEAARKYNRIVQSGTQRRSDTGLLEAIEYVRQGNLGRIILVRGIVYVGRGSIGKVDAPQPVPESVDYNLWTGPAPMQPLMRRNLHYDWHWVWPTGNGDLGNNGIHFMDICRWVLGKHSLAPRVMSIGGRFGYIDDGQTANTQIVFLDYEPAPIIFELRGLPRAKGDSAMDAYRSVRAGTVIHCEHGYVAGGWAYDNDGKKIKQFKVTGGGGHHANFIKAVRSRKTGDLNADILEGHLSSALCHMGNVSYRLGKQTSRAEVMDAIKGNSLMAEAFERMQEHLLVNAVDVKATPRILGPWLSMDPESETFVGDFHDKANDLVSREYRPPFVVPESV